MRCGPRRKRGHALTPLAWEEQRRARKRAMARQKAAEKRAAQDHEIQELRERFAAASAKATTTTTNG